MSTALAIRTKIFSLLPALLFSHALAQQQPPAALPQAAEQTGVGGFQLPTDPSQWSNTEVRRWREARVEAWVEAWVAQIGQSTPERLQNGQVELPDILTDIDRGLPAVLDLSKLSGVELPPDHVGPIDVYAVYDDEGVFQRYEYRPPGMTEAGLLETLETGWKAVAIVITYAGETLSSVGHRIRASLDQAARWACGLGVTPDQVTVTVDASIGRGGAALGGSAGVSYDIARLCAE